MNNNLIDTIVRPTLLLDERKTRLNIQTMAEKARRSRVEFRPHFKTHQSAGVGAWFKDEGVQKITVSSVDMAAYFAASGWDDITIAFPVNIRQISIIQELAEKVNLGVLVEDLETIHFLGKSISSHLNIWIKIDCGLHRTGIPWDQPQTALDILTAVGNYPLLTVQGLLTHAGDTYSAPSAVESLSRHTETIRRINMTKTSLSAPNLKISIGDTPGCSLSKSFPSVDEIRPGNFVFYDAEQWEIGSCTSDQIAIALACPVVAIHPERDEIVLYGGAVHLSKETFIHMGKPSFGLAVQTRDSGWGDFLPGCTVSRTSQEHGILSVPHSMLTAFHRGDLVLVVPAHSCLTAHLMRHYLTLDSKIIEMMPI